jgi:predicted hotdog family 3-hydroxylacyl-ACP dehydratase
MDGGLERDIDSWIPHRGAMQLLDRVIAADDEHAVAEVDIAEDGLFFREGHVPAWIGIEYMAQTISAWAGGRARRSGATGPRIGLLLGSRRYTAHCAGFPAGATLRIEARCELNGANGLGLFDCRITQGDTELATARVAVFEPEDAMAMLKSQAVAAEGAAP